MAENQNKGNANADLGQLRMVRREKLANLQAEGRDPFLVTKYDQTHHTQEIKDNYAELEGKEVSIAGRMMSKRIMGKASFCDIQDRDGHIQVYVARDDLGEEAYKDFKKMDIGDIVGIKGIVFTTKMGEISVHASSMLLMSKSLQILPEKYHGLTNTDLRYRQRYVDLIMNQESKETFVKRSKIIKEIRNFLDGRDFIEVETPMLVPNAGGAAARPFETHFNALNEDVKLRISLELYLKRLIVGGLERVYEIGRVFRNEGVDTRHNPEFTLMELYQAYTDYEGMMELTESMFRYVAEKVLGTTKFTYKGNEIDFGKPFERISMNDAIIKYAGIDFDKVASDEEARELAKQHNIEIEDFHKKGDIVSLFFEEYCEEHLIQPTFVIDHPLAISPLTKKKPDDPEKVERFELFINTWEMANAYSELNDPIDQRERFAAQDANAEAGDEEAQHTDEDFLNALEIGMPPTGGIGYGIDRLTMLLTDSEAIRDVLLFPTMKSLNKPAEKKAKAAPAAAEAEDTGLKSSLTRAEALKLFLKYNDDDFLIRHALTVEGTMRWYARELGYANEEEFWGITGLLHDIDFCKWPEEHCQKAPELLKEGGVSEEMIHAIVSHGFGLCSEVEPELEMEKVLFAADELTGLIWSASLMRPSKSTKDMEVKSLKKKFKDKKFAAGCSREVISGGAEKLGWELDELMEKTILAMRDCEDAVEASLEKGMEAVVAEAEAEAAKAAPAAEAPAAAIPAGRTVLTTVSTTPAEGEIKIEPLFEDFVDFDTFSKSDFRAVKIKECEAVKKSNKLLKFVLDDGTGTDRIILSGIHEYYEPEDLVGKTCIAIVNLPPRKMMGIDSCGMLISAVHEVDGKEGLNLLMVDDRIPAGAKMY